MDKNLKDLFSRELSHLTFDKKFAKRVRNYTTAFINKNDDHVEFFGSPYIGVPSIRFTRDDSTIWFEDILDADELDLKDQINELGSIPANFTVQSNTFNLSLCYLLHGFANAKISAKDRDRVLVSLFSMLQFKFLTSLMSEYFKHPANRGIAVATYAALNNRFQLKVTGSWTALINAKSEALIDRKSIHKGTYEEFMDDSAIGYLLSDTQTRIREVVKAIVKVFYDVKEEDAKLHSSSSVLDIDGQEKLIERTDVYRDYLDQLNRSINTKSDFIRDVLVDIVDQAVTTMPPKLLIEALEYVVENHGSKKTPFVDELINETVIHAISFIRTHHFKLNAVKTIFFRIKSVYMASKASDPVLLNIRELADTVVKNSCSSKNDTTRAAVRTGLLLYITTRALTASKFK